MTMLLRVCSCETCDFDVQAASLMQTADDKVENMIVLFSREQGASSPAAGTVVHELSQNKAKQFSSFLKPLRV